MVPKSLKKIFGFQLNIGSVSKLLAFKKIKFTLEQRRIKYCININACMYILCTSNIQLNVFSAEHTFVSQFNKNIVRFIPSERYEGPLLMLSVVVI